MARVGLGIDAGGSATRWALWREGESAPFATGEAGPASGHLFDPAVRERSMASFATLVRDVAGAERPDAVAAGVTGLGAGTEQAETFRSLLSAGLGVPPDKIAIGDDMWIAYRAVFAPGEGGVIYAGTGSVGYAIRADGTALKVGGYGVVIDDGGSAFWIAREALRAVLRARDEDPGSEGPLAVRLYERVGGSSWAAIRAAVYGTDRGGVAALAPVVAAAAREGDATALAILEAAGRELARLGAILARRAPAARLAIMGGGAKLHPAIVTALEKALPPGVACRVENPAIAEAAARVALEGVTPPA
ncbi:hypothetical protein NK718_07070 [Alsobacter sp. SYSU M60028]|uniref:ATPase BadF/BadG/BcrA/BcrD type domain-containing protein n=1 Tax=Alsobacter ponti TaxID=2962936 RepID=A0ABT1L9V8_9HYPH|nr:hypothetical protein [Alsobacter ponti]